jgi:hypothetical protein
VYTQKRDVTRRLETILAREGIRVAVLTFDVPTEKRKTWFERKLRDGVQVTICHPRIIETGLDYVEYQVVAELTLSLETSSGQCPARYPLPLTNADLAHRRGG